MRAREPDLEGYVEHDGVKLHYEVHGSGDTTLLLMPTWTIIHKRFWKAQVAYLGRHFRVVTYDGPGNGRSERPLDPSVYAHDSQAQAALAVLDATSTPAACLVSLSRGAIWALHLAAEHPGRVLGSVFVAPSVDLAPPHAHLAAPRDDDVPDPPPKPSRVPSGGTDPLTDWAKVTSGYVQAHYEDFLWFFFGQCFSEPHSTKPLEDCVAWGLDTTGDVLLADDAGTIELDRAVLEELCGRVGVPVLVVHGDDDRIVPLGRAQRLSELTGGELLVLEGSGHIPLARDPVRVNLAIRDFVERRVAAPPVAPRRTVWRRGSGRRRRVLFLSSPIGLGHARRDLAIARELRAGVDGLEVDWLAQHPVTAMLDAEGERVHPASRWLANESAHIEAAAGEHDLHAFQALRDMDEILVANFMLFHDVVRDRDYDLVVGDEAWELDHFLHDNPELKRFAYAWMTDFVGMLPAPGSDRGPYAGPAGPAAREAFVAADVNAEMIAQVERFPWLRDRAVFVGDPDDVVPERFGPDLPGIRAWTEAHYDFAGYVTGFDPAALADRDALRADLGYAPGERVCVVTVGGSGVGEPLLRRVVAAYPEAARRVDGLRMVVVAGPRIDPASLPQVEGLDVRAYVPDLHRHLAACDLAVVQGGLTTCMELVATRRPFLYFPLEHHFEQQIHVTHRLDRHRAGRRMVYTTSTPETIADAIASDIGRPTNYLPVDGGGAARAAALLADLL